ncbi:hypothetical protein PGT21_032692 [Puccinia graminis f. sp. tritici]|uniref:RNase H type-1 domain-containing protein n=1 Tax=Puccinia graminis f. sp. tritici TaxID=56615 RepID=A0A5B0PZE9_PUCGR|nr:hypothetical protein PGT21_032692 [Puccinia graminis f. sp. tritici]
MSDSAEMARGYPNPNGYPDAARPSLATTHNKSKVETLANKVDRLAGIFSLGVFKSTSNAFIKARTTTPSFYNEAIRTSFSFFYRKIVFLKPNAGVRSFILQSRANPASRAADSARSGLATSRVDQALALEPENLHLTFDFGRTASRELEYVNLDATKEKAIESVKSIVSCHVSDPGDFLVFSDGSYHPEKGGARAAVCPSRNTFTSYRLGDNSHVSNHESEAAGVLAAIGLFKESCVGNAMRRVIILVDNQGVIRRTMDPGAPKPGQWFFKEIDKALADLPSCLKVSFVWCPGHRDILGNELADKLAKQALESSAGPTLRAKGNFKKVQRTALADLTASDKPQTPSGLHIASSSLINQLASGSEVGSEEESMEAQNFVQGRDARPGPQMLTGGGSNLRLPSQFKPIP